MHLPDENRQSKNGAFHFIAAGGVGQSALAKILLQRGYSVSGSDIVKSKYVLELENLGAKIFIGHNENNVPKNASVVISSAIKEDNPELKAARALGLNVLHRSDMLKILSKDFPFFIGFAGTHGKTTTSGLASYVLTKAGVEPAYAVGGIIPELNTNACASKVSPLFIAELDESDGTIVKYSPDILVINNLEADHPDYYKNGLVDVVETFKKLILSLPPTSKIIVNIDNEGVNMLLKELEKSENSLNIIKFSLKNGTGADIYAQNIDTTSPQTSFEVCKSALDGNFSVLGKIETSLCGIHNVYNCVAVTAALWAAGFDPAAFTPYFTGFSGMGRRFQTVYKDESIEIIDDYAHHPAEIIATLKAAKEYTAKSGKKRTVAIFQPHRYTRLKALWNDFLNAFSDCDLLIVLDAFSAGDPYDSQFNSENFAKAFKAHDVHYIKGEMGEVKEEVMTYIKDGDIVLTLGAGDITKLGGYIKDVYCAQKLDKRAGEAL